MGGKARIWLEAFFFHPRRFFSFFTHCGAWSQVIDCGWLMFCTILETHRAPAQLLKIMVFSLKAYTPQSDKRTGSV